MVCSSCLAVNLGQRFLVALVLRKEVGILDRVGERVGHRLERRDVLCLERRGLADWMVIAPMACPWLISGSASLERVAGSSGFFGASPPRSRFLLGGIGG